ncbi:g3983 [Coccomyxa viridis]|uniref:G3983 protein n=1 Tax=Coccomyxa viridis TaxID=1274662 RepID=A0ABP1FSD2_9CHLO
MDSRGRDCSTDTSCILDGEENDACEVLHLLANIITDELHDHFREHQSVALSSQAALQDILSLSWSCSSSKTADTEQAEPTLAAWKACRSPMELSQAQEIACLVCRRLTSTTVSSAVALPLVLPAVKGVLGNQSAHSRACEQHPELVGSANSADVELLTDSRQGLALLPEAAVDSIGPLPGQQSTRDRASVRHSKSAGNLSSADVRLLGGCLRGACPLPEAEVQSMAERAGMRWVQRRGTLLARTLIAQTPQVLCLQLQRVRWSNLGSPEKLHGHVAFPLSIDLSPCLAAAAKPLLGETPPEPAEREKGLTQAPQLFTDQETSMREEQQKAQLPGGSVPAAQVS